MTVLSVASVSSMRDPQARLNVLRNPKMVVKEMKLLNEQLDATVFMFQDDDFPVTRQKKGEEWALQFVKN